MVPPNFVGATLAYIKKTNKQIGLISLGGLRVYVIMVLIRYRMHRYHDSICLRKVRNCVITSAQSAAGAIDAERCDP